MIGFRYDATEIMQGVTEVLCYGTAVAGRASRDRVMQLRFSILLPASPHARGDDWTRWRGRRESDPRPVNDNLRYDGHGSFDRADDGTGGVVARLCALPRRP